MDHGSFKYCIVPKDHKSEEEIDAIAVEGAMQPKWMLCKTEENHLNIETLQLCSWIMPACHLLKCKRISNQLKMHPTLVPTFKKPIYQFKNVQQLKHSHQNYIISYQQPTPNTYFESSLIHSCLFRRKSNRKFAKLRRFDLLVTKKLYNTSPILIKKKF